MAVSTDVAPRYRMVPEDFVKHLFTTLVIIVGVVLVASILFGVPEKTPLSVKSYAQAHPVQYEQLMMTELDGQSAIGTYGPPYNPLQPNVQTPLQNAMGVIHPINTAQQFVINPLKMTSKMNPSIGPALKQFGNASPAQQALWEKNFTAALAKGTYSHGAVVTAPGQYGPLPTMMNEALRLGQSGLMTGALMNSSNNGAVYTRFNTQNLLLFLQGPPLHQDPGTQSMLGENWGIIHPAVNGYPGAWWMTVPTWIYQWSFVANSPAADGMALSIGFGFWLLLALTPWIPGLNRLPRYLGVHRLIWKGFYANHPTEPEEEEGSSHHAS